MCHVMTCGDAPNCTWTDLAMSTLAGVNCANHYGRNLSNSNYRGLDGEEEQLSVQGYGNVTSMQFTGSHNRCCTVLRIPAILRHLLCRQFGNIHVDSVLLTCVQCSHCKFTRLIIADRMLLHDRSCFAT